MKVIFLDIDGVLAIPETGWCTPAETWHPEHGYPWDSNCIKQLNFILATTGAEIVLSSSWRIGKSLEQLDELFKYYHVRKSPFDTTEVIWSADRGTEIQHWLDNTKTGITNYVVIDDDFLTVPNFVQTDMNKGLCDKEKVNQIIKILNSEYVTITNNLDNIIP